MPEKRSLAHLPQTLTGLVIDTDEHDGSIILRNQDGTVALAGEAAESVLIREETRRGVKAAQQNKHHPANYMIRPDPNAVMATKEGNWKPKDGQPVQLDEKGNVDPRSIEIDQTRKALTTPGHSHYLHPEFELIPVNPEEVLPLAIDTNKSDEELMTGKSMQTINGELVEEQGIPVASIGYCEQCGSMHDKYAGCDSRSRIKAQYPRFRFQFPGNMQSMTFKMVINDVTIEGAEWLTTKVHQTKTYDSMQAAVLDFIKHCGVAGVPAPQTADDRMSGAELHETLRQRALAKLSLPERRALGLPD